jgi:DNA-binding GntR family transcriptional regulator
MQSLAEILKPLDRGDGRRTAIEVYDTLQTLILSGRLKPGTIVSQVALARALKVSRTPVREAMRMLQEAGLLLGEPNYRSRVVGFDPEDVEALYLKRIPLEALGVAITTQRMSGEHLEQLRSAVGALESDQAHKHFERWQACHREFHRLIVGQAGNAFAGDLEQLELRSERYQSAYKGAHLPGWWQRGEAEHRALFDAMKARNAARAGELAARHLARTALELLAALAPEYDTTRLRTSLRFAIDGAKASASAS